MTVTVRPGRRAPAIDELERAFEDPPANVGDPFVHTFYVKTRRLLTRNRIRPGDVALCGYVASRAQRGVPIRKAVKPRCPECERRLREQRGR